MSTSCCFRSFMKTCTTKLSVSLVKRLAIELRHFLNPKPQTTPIAHVGHYSETLRYRAVHTSSDRELKTVLSSTMKNGLTTSICTRSKSRSEDVCTARYRNVS